MPKIYCNIGDIPKGHKRGSMKECAEKKQIKYYGEKKVDRKIIISILDKKKSKKNPQKELDDIKVNLASMVGKIKNITRKIENEDDKKKKKQYEKEKVIIEKEFEKTKEKLIGLKRSKQQRISGGKKPKKISKKRSKRLSKKS